MDRGSLSDYFLGVAWKSLSAVETDPARSHQHELNGDRGLQRLLGIQSGRTVFPARFIYLADGSDDPPIERADLTWYDARERHPTRTEWRLYYPDSVVMERAEAGDLLVIARQHDGSLLLVVAEAGSTMARQILWLFGLGMEVLPVFAVRDDLRTDRDQLDFASRMILESIGIEVAVTEEPALDRMIGRFGQQFPTTREFSTFAREMTGAVDVMSDPDAALMAWMTEEEILFRTLERHLVAGRLREGFGEDVETFIAYSLSVQNRRKSRVGYALENHLVHLFDTHGIGYARQAVTENRSKPDFVFPDAAAYHNPLFPVDRLTVLGVKSSCKERWRQVLAEAARVHSKHLLTLETAISTAQTTEMRASELQLVLPAALHGTYTAEQQAWLLTVSELAAMLQERQSAVG